MLAGLQSDLASLFPTLRNLTPDDETLQAGAAKIKFDKLVKLSGYKTEVFDLHAAKDRAAYSKRMMDLSQRAQVGTVRILVHDRQTLVRKDGSSGWFVSLEWMEYEWTDEGRKLFEKKEK